MSQTCDCKAEMEKAFAQKVVPAEAQGVSVSMGGYSSMMNMQSGYTRAVPAFRMDITYRVPKASGKGLKIVRERPYAIASFCPFCGKPLPTEAPCA